MDNYWEKIYKQDSGYYNDLDNPSRLAILNYIGSNDSILDLGCGGGALRAILPEGHYYLGLDYSETAIKIACQRFPTGHFVVQDSRNLGIFEDNEYDVVVMRHFLENQEDWKEVVKQSFRIANKKVIIVLRGNFRNQTSLVEQKEDTWHWYISQDDFNNLARSLSVNVSYGIIKQQVIDDTIIIIGKHLDDVIFDLDDFHDMNHNLPVLLDLKERFPKLKVNLFCIPSKCTPEFINSLKNRYGNWMKFYTHGFYHDTDRGPRECDVWTEEEANKYLQMAEDMNLFEKVFRPPGWCINYETYKILIERGYIIAEHLAHDRWPELGGQRYTTGHLMEVHGHVQACNNNGVEELSTTKCNFGPNTNFHFINEPDILDMKHYLPGKFQ